MTAAARPRTAMASAADARPGAAEIALHWIVAAGIFGMLAYGFWLSTLPSDPGKTAFVQIHKSFGMLVFAAILMRVIWRMHTGALPPATPRGSRERIAVMAVHGLLLAATLAMPLSGIVRSLAYARPVGVFGVTVIPQVVAEKHETVHLVASAIHEWTAWILVALVAVHICGALKHHLIDGDHTLRRMLGGRSGVTPR